MGTDNPYAGLTDEQLDALIAQKQPSGQETAPGPMPVLAPENKTLSEMKGLTKAGGTGLIKGVTDVAGMPGDVQSLGNAALGAAVNKFGPTPSNGGQQPPTPPGWYGSMVDALNKNRGALELPTSQGLQKKVEGITGPLYQPQTGAEKVASAAGEAIPFGTVGGGALLPNMARAGLAGGASEAAGQATEGTGFETPTRIAAGLATYGGSGMAFHPRINPTNAVQAAAQRQEAAGIPIAASDISGSRFQRTLEGGSPPAGRKQAVSDVMQEQGGIPIPPGNTQQYSDLADQAYRNLQTAGNNLGAQTSIPATPQLRAQLVASAVPHAQQFGGSTLEDPTVQQAIDNYDHFTMGGTPLSGTQYQALHQQWSASPVPELRAMSQQLDAAMDAAHPGAWEGWRQNFADYSGLKAESDRLGGGAIATPFSPDTITKAMYKKTPMYRTAEDAQTIEASQPKPYDFHTVKNIGSMTSALAGPAGGAYGLLHGGTLPAGELSVAGALVPHYMAEGIPAITQAASPFFRSWAGQRLMRNMDPKVVAALLAKEGVVGKSAPGEQPQAASQ